MASELPPAYAHVGTAYLDVWKVCPYTDFAMFDYLVKGPGHSSAGLGSWIKFLRDSGRNKPHLQSLGLEPDHITAQVPESLWKRNSGLCTSFSMRVAAESQVQEAFTYGNNPPAGHRAAWIRRADIAVVIDSSARKAIGFSNITKQPSQTTSYFSGGKLKKLRWNWVDDAVKKTQKLQTDAGSFTVVPTKEEALAICLRQLLKKTETMLLFRAITTSPSAPTKPTAHFFGKITWNFSANLQKGGHTCVFSGELGDNQSYEQTVEFRPANRNDPEAGEIAAFAFLSWLEQAVPGGTTRRQQFDDVWAIHWELWSAATEVWGGAKLLEQGKPGEPQNEQGKDGGKQTIGAGGSGSNRGGAVSASKTGPKITGGAGGSSSRPGVMDAAVTPVLGAVLKGTLTAKPKSQSVAS